jgi:hypothetical protein
MAYSSSEMAIKVFENEAHVNNIYEFSPYLKGNTTLHYYTDQITNVV